MIQLHLKLKMGKIVSVQNDFAVTHAGWSNEELERSKVFYEELCEKYHTC